MLHAIARPIRGETELDELAELVAHKRLVLFGAATLGTHELFDLRSALTRRLISHHGFAAVCVDVDWPDALRVDRYIRNVTDDDRAQLALGSFERFPRWPWRNDEVAALVEWMRRHGRCGFYGLDLYSWRASIHALLEYLDDNDAEAAARARLRCACFDHVGGEPEAPLGLARACEAEVVAQLVEVQRRKIARSGRSPRGEAWFHAIQHAHVIRDAGTYYRTMFADRIAAWNLRDTHLADTLDLIADNLGKGVPAKLVVWAHDTHVGDARATELGERGQLSLGQLVRERHPDETALVGFTTYEGAATTADHWGGAAQRTSLRPAHPESWEALFHEAELARFYLTSEELKSAFGDKPERLQRAIGVVYQPETERRAHYLRARLADAVDVVVHVDSTRALAPYETSSEGIS